jgi:hypothetical protein
MSNFLQIQYIIRAKKKIYFAIENVIFSPCPLATVPYFSIYLKLFPLGAVLYVWNYDPRRRGFQPMPLEGENGKFKLKG